MEFNRLIQSALPELLKGKVDLPQGENSQLFAGITDAVVGGLQSSAQQEGGMENILSLLQGKSAGATSPVVASIQDFFVSNIAGKLGLSDALANSIKAALPAVMDGLVKNLADGKLDLSEVIASLTGGNNGLMDQLKGMAGGLLGGMFK